MQKSERIEKSKNQNPEKKLKRKYHKIEKRFEKSDKNQKTWKIQI